MKELRIFDKADNNSIIVGLGELIKVINSINSTLLLGKWEVFNGAYGYGEVICQIEDKLSKGQKCLINSEELFPLLMEDEQYFYNVTLKKIDSSISIGVFDSTFIFFQSEDEEIIKQVMRQFGNTMIINS